MNTFNNLILLTFLLTTLNFKSFKNMENTSNDLIVRTGETKFMNTRTYRFDNVLIEQGGKLIITEQSTRWFILWVSGDVTINGEIEAINFKIGPRTVIDNTPDNKKIEHIYHNDVLGGTGGFGGISRLTNVGSRTGGQGALGTNKYGGGGGSGAGVYLMGAGSKLGGNGVNAIDWRGAPLTEFGYNNTGGNGGKVENSCNGGLIFIYCGGTFNGSGGRINLSGKNGENGQNGGHGDTGPQGSRGSGGGGGGAPGGEGGHFILVTDKLDSKCSINIRGGRGGNGGNAGQHQHGATNGSNGRNGSAGIEDYYKINEW
jgi:hypothetical protein